jgi:biotin transport system substrate-specific component
MISMPKKQPYLAGAYPCGIHVRGLVLCGLFAALTAIGAFLKIPLPPPFVPFTLQTTFCILAGLLLGPSLGAASQAAYVIIGLIGLPVFTQGGGPGYVFVPTFGYLIGFIISAWLCGAMTANKPYLKTKELIPAVIAGLIADYAVGVAYMYLLLTIYKGQDISVWKLVYAGALVYLPGNLLFCLIACMLTSRLRPVVCR